MQKKIFYWSPHINEEIATVKAVLNSAHSLSKYSKKYRPFIINAFGEWDNFYSKLNSLNISLIKILNFKSILPIHGFLKSRLFYIFFSLVIFFPLIKMIKKEKPDIIIVHLITVPVLLAGFFLKKTKFILRISGFPKLNFFRSFLWKISSKNIIKVFTPTKLTKEILIKKGIFGNNKVFLLEDPIIEINKLNKLKREKINDLPNNPKYIISIGRLTSQKNFSFLTKSFAKIKDKIKDVKLVILGSGEEEKKIKEIIKNNNLEEDILLKDYKKNPFNYLDKSILFVMTSEWEDPGFVIIEAAACNKLILSSDVLSGPREFINNEESGLLFQKNNFDEFKNKILNFFEMDDKFFFEKKLSAKRIVKNYTVFRHFTKLSKYLDD